VKTEKQEEVKKENVKIKHEKIKPEDVVRYSPDINEGLTAEQVNERVIHDLTNSVDQKYTKSYASIICGNLFTFFNLLGIIVTVALIYVKASISRFFFCGIYILNIAIGIIQEIRAKLSIEKLSLIASKNARVIRSGKLTEISSKDIVLDDIVVYSIGNQILTDCEILEGEVEVNESLLTGESIAIKKKVGDKLYAGSFITSGNCHAIASSVGKDNYVEKPSAKAKKYKKPNSDLMRSLSILITVIGFLIIPIAILNIVKMLAGGGATDVTNAIDKTSGLIIGMIPSGMFLLTSMALAVGVIRLAKSNTLVQDLYSLEMLARVDVLCLDKTGTITDGRMKVRDCILL
ncbi:MAG: HAD-IC family P-type ATPase, partial [Clostridia bacterium]|nr:HAD-IC family P-type ATPase [Clostridia bacterium]